MLTQAGGALAWDMRWRSLVGKGMAGTELDEDGRQHEFLCRLVETLLTFDQTQGEHLATLELSVRQIQLLEERAHGSARNTTAAKAGANGDGKNKTTPLVGAYDQVEAGLCLGVSETRGNLCICPSLQEWIAEQLRAESAVAKERRKAREERAGRT